MIFSELYKKRGFHETLFSLYSAKNYALALPEFFEKLEELDSYYNAFFRVKNEMLKYDIIAFKKNRYKDKVISLTPKGVAIVKKIKVIQDILDLEWEDFNKKQQIIKKRAASRKRRIAKSKEIVP